MGSVARQRFDNISKRRQALIDVLCFLQLHPFRLRLSDLYEGRHFVVRPLIEQGVS
jgi:hypothetical protein